MQVALVGDCVGWRLLWMEVAFVGWSVLHALSVSIPTYCGESCHSVEQSARKVPVRIHLLSHHTSVPEIVLRGIVQRYL